MAFTLKGEFSKVAAAVETEWTNIKTGASDVEEFITTQGNSITNDTDEFGLIVKAALPGAAGAVNALETLESKVMAIVLTGSTEIANATAGNAPQTITALKALAPQLLAAAQQVAAKPAVASVNS